MIYFFKFFMPFSSVVCVWARAAKEDLLRAKKFLQYNAILKSIKKEANRDKWRKVERT